MSELKENVNETPTEGLDEVMDTNVSGGTLEFVKENATGIAILCMAGYGVYQAGKKGLNWIKSKLPSKDPEKQRLAAKKAEKQVAKDEKKPKEET